MRARGRAAETLTIGALSVFLHVAGCSASSTSASSTSETGGGTGASSSQGNSGSTSAGSSGQTAASSSGSSGQTVATSSGGTTGGSSSTSEGGTGSTGPGSIAGSALFFSDLTSAPNQGGQNDKGAFVTVWGNGFGDSRGVSTVTIGGGEADNYPIWTRNKITFQLGANAKSGDIVVRVAGKSASNPLSFMVRAGNIFFVTSSGSDSNNGSFASPWKTIPKAKNTIATGDIAYLGVSAGDSVSQTTVDSTASYRCALGMSANGAGNSGTASAPKALVAYPGALATIGAESGLERGILTPAIGGSYDYWVISQLTLRGETEALDFEASATGWRVVGNDISCPNGTGLTGCVEGTDSPDTPGNLVFFGNDVHDAAANVTSITKYYHGIYFASNHLELGWNTVRDGKTCRAIQFHDSGGPNEFDIVVHDNVIHGTVCDGINFATVDPSQGSIVAYNNVVYDVGQGPDPADGSSDYACIYVANITNAGSAGSGNVRLYNNTMYNCGQRGGSAAGAVALDSGPVGIQMDDNLIALAPGESYLVGARTTIAGSNNLLFGAGAPPASLTGSVTGDPSFVDAASGNFHLTTASAAVDQGNTTMTTTDIDGNPRPEGAAFDIGAYELTR